MPEDELEVIADFKKSDSAYIKASLTTWKGDLYIDIREFVESERYSGPTKKGVRFNAENWTLFKEMVDKIEEEMVKRQ